MKILRKYALIPLEKSFAEGGGRANRKRKRWNGLEDTFMKIMGGLSITTFYW